MNRCNLTDHVLDLKNKSDLEFVERLYIESFPPEERRSIAKMLSLIEDEPLYKIHLLVNSNKERVGFISRWNLGTFEFLEHFAISPMYRSEGYGTAALKLIIDKINLPLVGEIELITSSDYALKRSDFYRKIGFKICSREYLQPPYEEGFDAVPMHLISYGEIDTENLFDQITTAIYKKVYLK